jgi:hypothetical protein
MRVPDLGSAPKPSDSHHTLVDARDRDQNLWHIPNESGFREACVRRLMRTDRARPRDDRSRQTASSSANARRRQATT